MADDTAGLLAFLHAIEGDITSEAQPVAGGAGEFREDCFSRMIADDLEASGVLESPTVCHFEHGSAASAMKVSGYGVPDEDSRLDLFVTAYTAGPHADIPTVNESDVTRHFNRLERFLAGALNGLHERLDPALPERYMADRIHGLRGQFDRVNFLLFTNSRLAVRGEKRRKSMVQGVPASYDIWDLERVRRLRESGAGYEAVNVDMRALAGDGVPCVRLDSNDDGYRTCVAIFPGTLLRDLYDEHGSRLLELNVRSYLQARGKINKGIIETLRNDPADFMAFNNGITVVAENIVFGRLDNGQECIVNLDGMQIVNGGQTTASIHRAAKEFDADLSHVHVQAKIVTVDPERFNDIVPLISRYANSQNKVTEPDLQANHRFHVGFERVANREWAPGQTSKWFYERARGSYQTARSREGTTEARRREFDRKYPAQQRFTKEDLARFENCWRGLPYLVNRGAQKNFTQFMTTIKLELGDLPDKWEPTPQEYRHYIAKAILFRDVQRIVKADKSVTAYRINITTYTVSLLAEKSARRIDLDRIWNQQGIGDALRKTVSEWVPVTFRALLDYAQSQTVHMDNILKGEPAWRHMLSLDIRLPPAVQRELVSSTGLGGGAAKAGGADGFSNQDHNNAARCMELDKAQWMAVVAWGNGPGALKVWQLGIATTLAAYAAEGWTRTPSQKQAKHGAALIDAARAAGILTH